MVIPSWRFECLNYEIYYTCYVAAINGYLSIAGSWTRVSRVRAEYPNELDYNGCHFVISLNPLELAKQTSLESLIYLQAR